MKAHAPTTLPDDTAGTAALAICESLLLALHERSILPEGEAVGILRAAAAAHGFALPGEGDAHNAAVIALIETILARGIWGHRR